LDLAALFNLPNSYLRRREILKRHHYAIGNGFYELLGKDASCEWLSGYIQGMARVWRFFLFGVVIGRLPPFSFEIY